jgi:hypothetical protein
VVGFVASGFAVEAVLACTAMRSFKRRAIVVAVVALAAHACGGSTETKKPVAPSNQISFGALTARPLEERTQCVVKRLGNKTKVHVGAIHNQLGGPSHHMVVYRVSDTVEKATPFDCEPFVDTLDPTKGSPLMVTQKKDDYLKLPKGVAYTLDENQMVRLELHFINPSSADAPVTATSTFEPISDEDFKDEAGFLFIGNVDIKLAPRSTTTLGPTFFAIPRDYYDAKFFAITGHEHHLGTNVTIDTAADTIDPGKRIYEVPDWSWSEPKTEVFDPPIVLPEGGGFRFSCEWNNTTDQTVRFGESANAEMCFFWAYYYPSKGSRVCIHTKQYNGGIDACCPGSALCELIKDYLGK